MMRIVSAKKWRSCIAALILMTAVRSAGCGAVEPSSTESSGTSTQTHKKSVTPTPTQWNEAGIRKAIETAAQSASFVSIQDPVDWWEIEAKSKTQSKAYKDAQWQKELLQQHDLGVFLQIDPYRPHSWSPTAELPYLRGKSFADIEIRSAFIADAVQRVELYQPDYICLAMEINSYYEKFPLDFDNFVSLFKEAYAEIKNIKPDTVVFVSFQYEELLGVLGPSGNSTHEPRWDLIEKFEPEQDAIGISSYPMKTLSPPRFGDPKDLPSNYYTQIGEHTTKPIIFAELGWPSDSAFGGSPQNQAAFLRELPTLFSGLDIRLVNWMFLYDIQGFGPVFDSMGFFDLSGRAKPAWNAWRDLGPI